MPEVVPLFPAAELNVVKFVVPLSEKVNPVKPGVVAVRLTVEVLWLAATALLAVVIEVAHR